MRRREFLRAGAALFGAVPVGVPSVGAEYGPLGSVAVPGTKEAVVGDGDRVYLATTDGFAVVDASDRTAPEVVARTNDVGPPGSDDRLRRIWDVKYDDWKLLVAGQRWSGGPGTLGFAVVDVSDPANPRQVLFEDLEFSVHNCFLDGDVAYLTSGPDGRDTFTAYDVSGESATELATWRAVEASERWAQVAEEGGPGAHDLWVQDGLAYTASWDAGVFVVDVSDPANPAYVGEFGGIDPAELAAMSDEQRGRQVLRPPGNAHYVATDPSGNLLGVGGEAWEYEGEGGPIGIDLYDVSDPADATHRSTIEPPASPDPTMDGVETTAHNFEFRDGVLYSSWYQGGVKRHDVSDPADPVQETWWRRPTETSFWTARVLQAGESFVASSKGTGWSGDAGLYVFPDEAGRSVGPYDPTPTPDGGTPTGDGTPTGNGTTAKRTPGGQSPDDAGATTPGFGPLAAAAALGMGSWWAARRRDD